MPTYKTPGVYVEEISTLPPSVAEVSTAIPAFIGCTEKGPEIARVNTMLEYEELFGGPKARGFNVATADSNGSRTAQAITQTTPIPAFEYLMYYCLSHFFKNGGGSCYIVSIGDYSAAPTKASFETGLGRVEKEDEPTLILLTDAVNLDAVAYHSLCQQALAQCDKLGDRFAILDVRDGDVASFRNGVGANNLLYGAAYHPYLQTSLSYRYREEEVTIGAASGDTSDQIWQGTFGANGIVVNSAGSAGGSPQVKIVGASGAVTGLSFAVAGRLLTITNIDGETGSTVAAGWQTWQANAANDAAGFDVVQNGDGTGAVSNTGGSNVDLTPASAAPTGSTLAAIKSDETALYNQIKTALAAERITLPPSAAVAGIYASVDRDRGVWKAPANVGVSSVIGPVTKITHEEQEGLNVDPTGGMSINAIREFTGRGTLVWGARTLAGNDNEWRYVSVRRLFNMIEESSRKATSFAVFEPNDTTTWLKVRGMIESYLYGLWEKGALAGPTPEAAYFVHVGLGKTMTTQDILEGRMIVEIGVAAVRPAEFIILRFSHKLQEA